MNEKEKLQRLEASYMGALKDLNEKWWGEGTDFQIMISNVNHDIVTQLSGTDNHSKVYGKDRLTLYSTEHLPFDVKPKENDTSHYNSCSHPRIAQRTETDGKTYCDYCGNDISRTFN